MFSPCLFELCFISKEHSRTKTTSAGLLPTLCGHLLDDQVGDMVIPHAVSMIPGTVVISIMDH